jgi:hypothetical protein
MEARSQSDRAKSRDAICEGTPSFGTASGLFLGGRSYQYTRGKELVNVA